MKKIIFAAIAAISLGAAPAFAEQTAGTCNPHATQARAQRADIVDVAVSAGQFATLAAALDAADLIDTLKSEGPFTVFAPTDEAFRALPPGTVERLLRPENKAELVRLLSYHVVPGRIEASDLSGRQLRQATVAGPTIAIDARSGVSVNQARVIRADVGARNGVIHVVDRVLMPPRH
jgi:uncharacterized surface protein with fasciclin (FAS1) repeats